MYEKRVYELNQYLFGLLLPGTHVRHDDGGGDEEELQCCSVSAVQSAALVTTNTGHTGHMAPWVNLGSINPKQEWIQPL